MEILSISVKPLEWKYRKISCIWEARLPYGQVFHVWDINGYGYWRLGETGNGRQVFGGAAMAKQDCNRLYAQEIISCLEISP
jgi:hypothetical protein